MSRFADALRTQPLLFDGGMGTALIACGLDLAREPPEAWLHARPADVRAVHAAFAAAGADVLQTNSFGLLRLLRSGHSLCLTLESAIDLARQSVELTLQPNHSPLGRQLENAAAAKKASLPGGEVGGAADGRGGHTSAAHPPVSPPPAGDGFLSLRQRGTATTSPPLGGWIVASLGPSGLAPSRAEADQLRDWVTALSTAFAAAGADALHLETACDPTELAALLEGAWAGPLPVLVSMTVSLGQSGMETPLGVPLSRMLRAIEDSPVRPLAVGVNCSLPARRMRRAVSELAEWAAGRRGDPPRILVQPQVDEPAPDCKRPPTPETPERFANDLLLLREDGAELLGGCCGCRPEHIAAVRRGLPTP